VTQEAVEIRRELAAAYPTGTGPTWPPRSGFSQTRWIACVNGQHSRG
jgi:hypothetical protein